MGLNAVTMAAADPVFETLQRIRSMMESFDESLSQLCKDNTSESALALRKNLMEYYHDLHKSLQSRYETLKIKDKKRQEPGTLGKNKEKKISKVTGSSLVSSSLTEILSSVEVRPEIKILCDKADGHGLRNYIVDNINEFETLRNELAVALSKVPDAAKVVMRALEVYDLSESVLIHSEESTPEDTANRKAIVLLLEALILVFGNDDRGVVPSDVKDSAREIAKVCRIDVNTAKKTPFFRGAIKTFLKFLASFGIVADYERDELWGLLFALANNDETLELCRSLGLSPNISEFIDKLSKGGRQLEALKYADAFGMLDKVDHVGLLTSYLGDVEKAGKEIVTNAEGTPASETPNHVFRLRKQLDAVRAVIELVRKYGLQSDLLEDKLRKLDQDIEGRIKKSRIVSNMEKINRKKAAEKKTQEKEEKDGKKDAEKKAQHKKLQSFEPGHGLPKMENYASKRAKHASLNETTRVVGCMDSSKASPYNIDGVQNKYGIIGHDHHPSAFSAANTGLAAGAFTSAPSIAAQINNERRHHEGYPLAFGTSNRTPIGSSLHSSSYKLNFSEIDNNPLRASAYVTGFSANSSATQFHYERRVPELYTSTFGGGNTGSIGSSVYGSIPRTIPSDVNQGSHERSLGQSSGFAGRNMVPVESSGYGSGVSTVPPSIVSKGHSESRGSVIDRYLFSSR